MIRIFSSVLCRKSPDPLDEVVALALDSAETRVEVGRWARTIPDQRWDVPPAAVGSWAAGDVFGDTIERGPVRATGGMGTRIGNRYLHAAIWREQLTGLFPVVVELGFNATAAVTSTMGTSWLQAIPSKRKVSDSDFRLEPREIMDIFFYWTIRQSASVNLGLPRFAPADSQRSCAHVSRRATTNATDLAGVRPDMQTVRQCLIWAFGRNLEDPSGFNTCS